MTFSLGYTCNKVAEYTIYVSSMESLSLYSKPLKRLPFDCIRFIIHELDLRDVVNACLVLCRKEDIRETIKDRISPIRFFSPLVQDPSKLLYYMSIHRCVLSGSRAADYFCRGSCDKDSDWDFYVEGDIDFSNQVFGSMRQSLESMGIEWEESTGEYGDTGLQVIKGTMVRGKGIGQKVQLTTSSGGWVINTILSFHSTPVQCAITHYGAFHLYSSLSYDRERVVWTKSIERVRTHIDAWNTVHCNYHSCLEVFENTIEKITQLTVIERMAKLYELYPSGSGGPFDHGILDDDEIVLRLRALIICEFPLDSTTGYMIRSISALVEIFIKNCSCKKQTSPAALDKYESRGYSTISFSSYMLPGSGWEELPPLRTKTYRGFYRLRSANDSESTIVPFTGFGLVYPDEYITESVRHLSKLIWEEREGIAGVALD